MRIVFYSTCSNLYDETAVSSFASPSFSEQWDFLAEKHPEYEFIIATQMPGMFLVDCVGDEILKSEKVERKIIKSDREKEIADEIEDPEKGRLK